MDVIIKKYRSDDRDFLVGCMNGMEEYIAAIDPLKRSKHAPDFSGEKWADHTLQRVQQNNGIIFIAEYEGKSVGCIIGIIKIATEEDLLDTLPFKDGRIIELFVDPSFRGQNIGSLLVEKIEQYFRESGCGVSELGCFATNGIAHKFYEKKGYSDRNIDMCKKLTT